MPPALPPNAVLPPSARKIPLVESPVTPPAPAPVVRAKLNDLIFEEFPIEAILRIDPVKSKLLRTKLPVARIAITDPSIVEITQYNPNELEFYGKRSGETSLTLWFGQMGGELKVLRYLVKVGPDLGDQMRAEEEYKLLESRINEMFPNSQVQLIPILDKLIVRGQARDAEEATQIMGLLRGQGVNQGGFSGGVVQGAVGKIPGAEDLPAYNVISLLEVPGEKQVMLKVRIAELTRSALRELGLNFNVLKNNFNITNSVGGASNISAILEGGDINLFIRAFSSNGNAKILAEPTLVTLSGRTATFLAGGEFAVPTVVGVDGVGAATTTFRGFGTQLNFTPTVLDKDRIRLQVRPSFSTLNSANAVNGIPGLNTRSVQTMVDLREGQWLAIAGLIQDQQAGTKGRIPWLGDIPVAGALFSSNMIKREETELVVLVSPELVHPLEPEQVPLILPGVDVTEPTDKEFFWHQRIEGDPNCQHRSTVWPQHSYHIRQANMRAIHEAKRQAKHLGGYQNCQSYYISGPHGFSD